MTRLWRRLRSAPPTISVVIPSWNSAATLPDTLDCLLRQSFADWEAIIVDDGSSDDTLRIALRYWWRDPRVRLRRQKRGGPSAARNIGIRHARGRWLLFLDSDDWIADDALERFLAAASDQPQADVICAEWVRVEPDGALLPEPELGDLADPLPVLARYCPFAIHSCLAKTEAVRAIGGFDPALHSAEDWDLWQRLARAGRRFVALHERLAFYRMRSQSQGLDPARLLADGLTVIARGHADAPPADLSRARLGYACWPAGMLIGSGSDGRRVLDSLAADRAEDLDPHAVAHTLFKAILLPRCLKPDDWFALWPEVQPNLTVFLGALEQRSSASGLAAQALREMMLLIIAQGSHSGVGTIERRICEVSAPIADIRLPAERRLLICDVSCRGVLLGTLEMPVTDGLISAATLDDAIATQFAWQILGAFFAEHVYPELKRVGGAIFRADLCIAAAVKNDSVALHDAVGWTVFLQELWGRPDWTRADFFDPAHNEPSDVVVVVPPEGARLELSDDVAPSLLFSEGNRRLHVSVGGAAVATLECPGDSETFTGAIVRAFATGEPGFELCRVAVREALIGSEWNDGRSLRQRLRDAARFSSRM